jgi:signal transduction histidine kinase
MTTTILKISKGRPRAENVLAALQEAGIGVIEVSSWEDAAHALSECEAALVVCDGELLEAESGVLTKAISGLASRRKAKPSIPPDLARTLSHDLRTPLSAMAGWLHLMESGTLDAAGQKRAIGKLRGNIDDQVRAIERHFGVSNNAGS